MKKRFGKNDLILISVLVILCAILMVVFYVIPAQKAKKEMEEKGKASLGNVRVEVEGKEFGTYPLDTDITVEITDEDGYVTNIMVIRDGKADMVQATCPDKQCVYQPDIYLNHQSLICLPNRVTAAVEDGRDSEVDIIAQ